MIASWHDFYLMAGGALAALTGLLFVAMSIHLKEILARPRLTRNVAIALYGMLAQLLLCGLMLVPGLTLQVAGLAVLGIGLCFGFGYIALGKPRGAADLIANSGMGFIGALIGVMLIAGWAEALYAYATVLGMTVLGLVRLCWLLLTMAITGLTEQRARLIGQGTVSAVAKKAS
jgi:hypothetical protein